MPSPSRSFEATPNPQARRRTPRQHLDLANDPLDDPLAGTAERREPQVHRPRKPLVEAREELAREQPCRDVVRPFLDFPVVTVACVSDRSGDVAEPSAASQHSRQSSREELDDSSLCFPSSAGSAVAVQERLCEPLVAVAAQEKLADLEKLYAWFERLDVGCSLGQALRAAEQIADGHAWQLEAAGENNFAEGDACRGFQTLLASVRQAARGAASAARRELQHISSLTGLCRQFSAMDFRFLFHPRRKLLAVGFNVSDQRCDDGCYDLLASEARLTSFLAVSHGQLPREHWFALGRMVALVSGTPTLLSWSGSMFEYLLPILIMPSYRATLLDTTCRVAVKHQMRYARRRGVPWGISESCSSTHGASDDYGYRAFGVPGLGIAPDLEKHLVIAPYAAALGAGRGSREACENLSRLERLGYLSSYGFYDAIDYTADLRRPGSPAQPCKIVMAHHSGMTLLALTHALLGPTMPQRFLRNPSCAAHDILLQTRAAERVPGVVVRRSLRLTLAQCSLARGGGYFSCDRPNAGRRAMALSAAADCPTTSTRAKNT